MISKKKKFSTKVCQMHYTFSVRYPKGGGWAKPKNGEANFWARSWRCGVSEANTAKANFLKNIFVSFFPFFANLSNYAKLSTLLTLFFRFPIALRCCLVPEYVDLFPC
jgi:hypothetical protein